MTKKPHLVEGQAMLTFLEKLSRGEIKAWAVTYIDEKNDATIIDETEIGWFSLLGAMGYHIHVLRSKLQ